MGAPLPTDSARAGELADRWRRDLAAWAIPEEILAQAEEAPWGHPVAMFRAPETTPDSPSHSRAREALPVGGTVLDVGCGGGRASLALLPEASRIIGVDNNANMLDSFRESCQRRGVLAQTVLGSLPGVAMPRADVVVCHHVLFNVPDIVPFLLELDAHAKRRVVIEIPRQHPQTTWSPLWERFWGLRRPSTPHGDDIVKIAEALGLAVHAERWLDETWGARVALPEADRLRYARIRLCLPADREAEVAAAWTGESGAREMLTIWWDHYPDAS